MFEKSTTVIPRYLLLVVIALVLSLSKVSGNKRMIAGEILLDRDCLPFMEKHVIDHELGGFLWNIGGDRKVTFEEAGTRIENYHHPRHLMLNILSLERIIRKGGKVISL